ncbi:hypothetical protein GCM10010353_50940 [Streptomyces chryseus]|nr:hypothetical protein GCM10010353_50940 [Streptomyces chryseus]
MQSADVGGQLLVLSADSVVEREGELHEPVEEREPCGVDVGVQALRAAGRDVGAGVELQLLTAQKLRDALRRDAEDECDVSSRHSMASE